VGLLNYMALVKHNNNSISAVTSMASLTTGSMTLIKEQTASSSASISFVDGSSDVVLDSTYPIYKFEFINLHPSTNAIFRFNLSTDSGSNYNVTKTSTNFRQIHRENDTETGLGYNTAEDLAQSTSDCSISSTVATNSDDNLGGTLYLFNPSSTTFVKHFMANTNVVHPDPASYNDFTAGYGNTTSAVDGVRFKFASGNIDSGTIKLYGIKDS
jgi:hypothetical protein